MSSRPWFRCWASDWLGSARVTELTAAQQGVYWRLLCSQWDIGSLPADPRKCRPFAPWDSSDEDVRLVVEAFFPLAPDGRRRNPKLDDEQANADARSASARDAANMRWGMPTGCQEDANADANACAGADANADAPGHAPAMLARARVQSQSPESESRERGARGARRARSDEIPTAQFRPDLLARLLAAAQARLPAALLPVGLVTPGTPPSRSLVKAWDGAASTPELRPLIADEAAVDRIVELAAEQTAVLSRLRIQLPGLLAAPSKDGLGWKLEALVNRQYLDERQVARDTLDGRDRAELERLADPRCVNCCGGGTDFVRQPNGRDVEQVCGCVSRRAGA